MWTSVISAMRDTFAPGFTCRCNCTLPESRIRMGPVGVVGAVIVDGGCFLFDMVQRTVRDKSPFDNRKCVRSGVEESCPRRCHAAHTPIA